MATYFLSTSGLMLVFGSGGRNALYFMAREGNEPALRFWLELNADVNAKIWYTAHALANVERSKQAQRFARYEVVSFLPSPETGAFRDGSTALMAAASFDHATVVRLLLRHNARVNEQDKYASPCVSMQLQLL